MCGACGSAAGDWAEPLVSGAARRQSIARLYSGLCPGLGVSAFGRGWTIRTATGAGSVAAGLSDLARLSAAKLRPTSWEGLESQLPEAGAPVPEDYSDYVPLRGMEPARLTLQGHRVLGSSGAPTHLRLAAFLLGVAALGHGVAYADFAGRSQPFRLWARDGQVVGAEEL